MALLISRTYRVYQCPHCNNRWQSKKPYDSCAACSVDLDPQRDTRRASEVIQQRR